MLISDQGTLVRTPADQVSLVGRNTQGVRLIAVRDDERLVRVARIVEAIAGADDVVGADDATPGAGLDPELDTGLDLGPDVEGPADIGPVDDGPVEDPAIE